jgi:hypothetical protein
LTCQSSAATVAIVSHWNEIIASLCNLSARDFPCMFHLRIVDGCWVDAELALMCVHVIARNGLIEFSDFAAFVASFVLRSHAGLMLSEIAFLVSLRLSAPFRQLLDLRADACEGPFSEVPSAFEVVLTAFARSVGALTADAIAHAQAICQLAADRRMWCKIRNPSAKRTQSRLQATAQTHGVASGPA